MPRIVVQGSVIQFPDTSESPDWSQAVIDFAQAVEVALSAVAGAYDVSPQVFNIDAQNPTSTNINIPNCTFSITAVRAVLFNITTSRVADGVTYSEYSSILAVYNASNGAGLKWELSREQVGDAAIAFNMPDVGQLQFTTTQLPPLPATVATFPTGIARTIGV